MSALTDRLRHGQPAEMKDDLRLCVGGFADYRALCEHHYRAARPRTMTRVLALRLDRPTVIGRFLQRRDESQAVAVLVESLPSLGCRLREQATGGRYAGIAGFAARAKALNAEIRCISRVIVHPPWRGAGLAVRLVKAALASAETPLTEAIAVMGAVNPFFERAGMTAYRAPRPRCDERLSACLASLGLAELDLALASRFEARLASLPAPSRSLVQRELRRWFVATMYRRPNDLAEQLDAARHWLLCDPVYYLHRNHNPKGARDGTCDDPARAAEAAPDEQQRDARGAAGEAGRAPEADGSLSAGDRAPG